MNDALRPLALARAHAAVVLARGTPLFSRKLAMASTFFTVAGVDDAAAGGLLEQAHQHRALLALGRGAQTRGSAGSAGEARRRPPRVRHAELGRGCRP
jgi:hypothetical protein